MNRRGCGKAAYGPKLIFVEMSYANLCLPPLFFFVGNVIDDLRLTPNRGRVVRRVDGSDAACTNGTSRLEERGRSTLHHAKSAVGTSTVLYPRRNMGSSSIQFGARRLLYFSSCCCSRRRDAKKSVASCSLELSRHDKNCFACSGDSLITVGEMYCFFLLSESKCMVL
jgi:hypothetical protein